MSKDVIQGKTLALLKSSGAFYEQAIQTTRSLDAQYLSMTPVDVQKFEVQPVLFYRVNGDLNEQYDILASDFNRIKNELLSQIQLVFDEHEIAPDDVEYLLDITDAFNTHKTDIEDVCINDRQDNVNRAGVNDGAILRSPGSRNKRKSFAGDPFYALDQRLVAMIGAIRAIEISGRIKSPSLAKKLEQALTLKRRQGLLPRDYLRDVAPVLSGYIEQSLQHADVTVTQMQAAPWLSDLINALIEQTKAPNHNLQYDSKEQLEIFLDFIRSLLQEAQKTQGSTWLPISSWMGITKQAQDLLKDKLAGLPVGEKVRADLEKAIDKLAFGRSRLVEDMIKQALDDFIARAKLEGWFVMPYCAAWSAARKQYREIEGFIENSIAKRYNLSEALLISISTAHESVFAKHILSLKTSGKPGVWIGEQRQKLKSILSQAQTNNTLSEDTVTHWESQYRCFWQEYTTQAEQHYVSAASSVMGKPHTWQKIRAGGAMAREDLTQSGNMLFSFEVTAKQSILAIFDRLTGKAYDYTIGSKGADRKGQLQTIRANIEQSQSGAEVSYHLNEAIVSIEADHASTSLAYNINPLRKNSRAVTALKLIKLECEDASLMPRGHHGELAPVLNRAQLLFQGYFGQFIVASLFERHCAKRLLDIILQQQDRVRRSSKQTPYTLADACYAISEGVDSIYEQASAQNSNSIWARLLRALGCKNDSGFQKFLSSFCNSLNCVQRQNGQRSDNGYYKFDFFAVKSRPVILEQLRKCARRIEQIEPSMLSRVFQDNEGKGKAVKEVRACVNVIERYRGDAKRISLTLHGLHDYLEQLGEGYAQILKKDLDWLVDNQHLKSRAQIIGISDEQANNETLLSEYDKELRQKMVEQEQAAIAVLKKIRP